MGRSKVFRRFKELLKKILVKKILTIRAFDIPNYHISKKEIDRTAHNPMLYGNLKQHSHSKKDQLSIQERKALERFQYRDDTYFDSDEYIID